MSGPARAGLFIYAKDPSCLASFYETVVGFRRAHESAEILVLDSADIQLLVHALPEHIAPRVTVTSPPERRENTALKFFFTVDSIARARESAERLGGTLFEETWPGPGFLAQNAMDPEGNVFQLRELTT